MRLSSELTINLNHLEFNFNLLKKIAPSNEIIFMVKGNAYGHGILEVSRFAYHKLGIRRLGCASLGEALYLREQLKEQDCEIWIFSDSNLYTELAKKSYDNQNISPVISNLEDLNYFLNQKEFKNTPLIIKLDTGMHRLGISDENIIEVIDLIKSSGRKCIDHLMTHFASSYIKLKDHDRTNKQYTKFKKALVYFKEQEITIKETSVSNSGAIEQGFGLEESHIRPGLMLYGPKSCFHSDSLWKGKNLSSLKTEVLKIMPVKKGTPIGYGGHVVGGDGDIVFIPIGYADGILTFYSGKKFSSYSVNAKILGRVNMDITQIHYENLPEELKVGSDFYFWKDSDNLAQLAFDFGTTPYQILTAITQRVPKKYIGLNYS